jgi:hypothetical protein
LPIKDATWLKSLWRQQTIQGCFIFYNKEKTYIPIFWWSSSNRRI